MKFTVITTCRNAEAFIAPCIESVRGQTHTDWQMVAVCDAPLDGTYAAAEKAAQGDRRVQVIETQERRGSLRNQVEAIDKFAPHDSVLAFLDGDDRLSDADVLTAVADEYAADRELDVLWTQHVTTGGNRGISGPLPESADPLSHPWCTSALRTWRKRLLWGMQRQGFVDGNGEWWMAATDQALMLQALILARRRKFLNRVCYVYNRNTGSTNTWAESRKTDRAIRDRLKQLYKRHKRRSVLFFVNGPKGGESGYYDGEKRPPLGVLSMVATLRARGHGVRLVDRWLNPNWWPMHETLDWADVAGVYCSTPYRTDAYHIIRELRRHAFPGPIIAGGPHAMLYPDDLKDEVECLCLGEADTAIIDIVEQGLQGVRDVGRAKDLDALPFPDYAYVSEHGLKYLRSWPFGKAGEPVWPLSSSRGCPHRCSFCESWRIWGNRWAGQSPERMLLDAEYLVRRHDASGVYYREDNFTCSPDRVKRFCELLSAQGAPKFRWACEGRVDACAESGLVTSMAQAGCVGIYLGVEAGTDRMLAVFNKQITADQIRASIENAKASGIKCALSFVRGHPEETPNDRAARERLVREASSLGWVVWQNRYRVPARGLAARPAGTTCFLS